MTLYEICPTCKGAKVYKHPETRDIMKCYQCDDGYIVHICPRDDNCPCFTAGMDTNRTHTF